MNPNPSPTARLIMLIVARTLLEAARMALSAATVPTPPTTTPPPTPSPPQHLLTDVRGVFQPGEPGLPWVQIAHCLAQRCPEHYADTTAEAISARVRAHGVPSRDIKHQGRVRKGARTAHIDQAITNQNHHRQPGAR